MGDPAEMTLGCAHAREHLSFAGRIGAGPGGPRTKAGNGQLLGVAAAPPQQRPEHSGDEDRRGVLAAAAAARSAATMAG